MSRTRKSRSRARGRSAGDVTDRTPEELDELEADAEDGAARGEDPSDYASLLPFIDPT